MGRSKKIIAIAGGIFLLILAFFIANRWMGRTRLNEGTVQGNTGGNLYNSGLFCAYGDTVYFANPADGNKLYSMDPNGDNLTCLSEDAVLYINVDEHYIYYTRNNTDSDSFWGTISFSNYSLCRMDKNGKHVKILDADASICALLVDNTIYYAAYDDAVGSVIYKIGIDGSDKTKITEDSVYFLATDGSLIYYAGDKADHDIHAYNIATGTTTVYLSGYYWMPQVDGGYLYYLSPEDDYALYRMNMRDKSVEKLISERVDHYNVSGEHLVYQTSGKSNTALMLYNLEDNYLYTIAEGFYVDLNIVGNTLYYHPYEEDAVYYRTDLDDIAVGVFGGI